MSRRPVVFAATFTTVFLILLLGTLYQTGQTPWRPIHISTPHLASWLLGSQDSNDTAATPPDGAATPPDNNTVTAIASPPQEQPQPESTQPRTILVIATVSSTDNSWIDKEMGDLLGQNSSLTTAIYVADNPNAEFHTPVNRGNEAMVYLTYMIDFYDKLPDVSIFVHGHRDTWHNNYLLDMSTAKMIRHLNRTKVLLEGYFNLRCHLNPGCPEHIHPKNTDYNPLKKEEFIIAGVWRKLFPEIEVPTNLAQPCCSQFALTRDRIHSQSVDTYKKFQHWLMTNNHPDYVSGRVFEYFWQYIFKGTTTFCPDPRICYCEAYGACFEDPGEYSDYFELRTKMGKTDDKEMKEELDRRKAVAFEVGADPVRKAASLEAARQNPLKETPKDGPPHWT